jgi:hypothetical protein
MQPLSRLEPRLQAAPRHDARRGKPQDFVVGLIEEILDGEKGLQVGGEPHRYGGIHLDETIG